MLARALGGELIDNADEADRHLIAAAAPPWISILDADNPGAHYRVPSWPATPPGKRWREVTQERDVPPEWIGREPIFAWEAKVYTVVPA